MRERHSYLTPDSNIEKCVALSGDACPPNIPLSEHEQSLHAFIEAANKALARAYPHPPAGSNQRYSQVSVLLLRWKRDDLGVISELRKLQEVFEKSYGYDTESFDIPEDDPETALVCRVLGFRSKARPGHLLIIYYGGHSDNSHPEHAIWRRCAMNELPCRNSADTRV